jgi:replicative DNA helicase
MAVAYLTGINEAIIKKNQCTPEQKIVVQQALEVFKHYEDNFRVVRVPSPSITLIKQLVREQVTLHDIRFVFYDYIFVSPSLLSEFRGQALRNDEILLMFSDALKQLAVELDIFLMSSTQVNAHADSSNDIRNEASLAGSRAVINKADVGCIMARPTKEELKTLEPITEQLGVEPNVVTDIYKLRGGENTQTRVWSVIDLGTVRKKDLFVTDARLDQVDIGYQKSDYAFGDSAEEKKKMEETMGLLADLNGRSKK